MRRIYKSYSISFFRDALSDLAIHFLDKIKTMVIKDIEREDIEFVCKTLGCRPIASLDHFTAENLVNVDLVEEINEPGGKYIKVNMKISVVCRDNIYKYFVPIMSKKYEKRNRNREPPTFILKSVEKKGLCKVFY